MCERGGSTATGERGERKRKREIERVTVVKEGGGVTAFRGGFALEMAGLCHVRSRDDGSACLEVQPSSVEARKALDLSLCSVVLSVPYLFARALLYAI